MPVKINGKEYDENEINALVKAGVLSIAQKNDPASSTTPNVSFHGPAQSGTGVDSSTVFGLFSDGQARPLRTSAVPRHGAGLSGTLPIVASQLTNETLDIMTGQTAGGTSNATGFTDNNPPKPGQLKVARQTTSWGSHYIKTDFVSPALVGQRRHYADRTAMFANMAGQQNPLIPDILFRMTNSSSPMAKMLMELGIDMERTMDVVAVRGQAGTDNSRTGWFAEFAGLDSIVATGKTDSVTGLAAPALDSDVQTFDAIITGTDGNSRTIVEAVTDLVYALKDRARQANVGMPQFAFVGRTELFRALTDVWPDNYSVYRVSGAAGTPMNSDARDEQRMRQEMLNQSFLYVDGIPIPFIQTEGVALDRQAVNMLRSDLFVIPITANNMLATYLEYFPMDNAEAMEFITAFGFNDFSPQGAINNGMYLVGRQTQGLGIEFLFGSRWRMIAEFPWLMGRLDDIEFAYYANTRSTDPGLTYLHANGGVTYRS